MISITASELKTKGVSALEPVLQANDEAVITVRGKDKYVVVNVEQYNKLREYELEVALMEARADIANGDVERESVEDHIKRISK